MLTFVLLTYISFSYSVSFAVVEASYSLPNPYTYNMTCPLTESMCYDIDEITALRTAHLMDSTVSPLLRYEEEAILVITRDFASKSVYTYTYTDCGSSGFAHRRPGEDEDPYNLGWSSRNECPVRDRRWRNRLRLFLYSPYSPAIQIMAWRRVHARVARHSRFAEMLPGHRAAMLSIANSSPNAAVRYMSRTRRMSRILEYYYADRSTLHRQRRIERINQMLERI